MAVEYKTVVKRTIYVSECECGSKVIVDKDPPRERLCPCGKWVGFKEDFYEGPDLKK